MVRIIKIGTKKKIRCPSCGALLRYDKNKDVQHQTLHGCMDIIIDRYTIKCPQCEHKIVV